MNKLTPIIEKAKLFFLAYKWRLFPLVLLIIFIPIIFYFFSIQKNLQAPSIRQQTTRKISQPSVKIEVSPTEQTEISKAQPQQLTLEEEVTDIAAGKLMFSQEPAETTINSNPLPDGSIEYQQSSGNPNRPNIQIVKNNVVVFKRDIINNATITDYSEFITNPPYASQGSVYYGPNAIILANPTLGIAVVYDAQSNQIYEQYLFNSMSVKDYKQKFGNDISNFIPTN